MSARPPARPSASRPRPPTGRAAPDPIGAVGPASAAAPAKGRSLKVEEEPGTAPTDVAPPAPGGPVLSPFQGHQRTGAPETTGSTDTIRVVAMLMALVMAMSAAAAVLVVVAFVGGAATGVIPTPEMLKPSTDGQDTDVAIHEPRPQQQPRPSGPRPAGPDPVPVEEPAPVAPAPPQEVKGTIHLVLKNGQLFNSIEAKCPSTPLVRKRGEIHGTLASIVLPNNEDCRVTFQGSSPEYTYLRGGQTKTCSFSPTNCH